jgi:hypothetical protein
MGVRVHQPRQHHAPIHIEDAGLAGTHQPLNPATRTNGSNAFSVEQNGPIGNDAGVEQGGTPAGDRACQSQHLSSSGD